MKKTFKRLSALILSLFLLFSSVCVVSAEEAHKGYDAVVLFTHDLHSHFLPSRDSEGGEFGGYARLATLINEQKKLYPDALLLDGGDFSMGSLFQTGYKELALELRLMGKLGYDATTFGNHEFDYLPEGLASMLRSAKESGDKLPAIVDANYLPSDTNLKAAFEDYGVEDYIILERGGIHFVIFGIFGVDSHDCAPNSGIELQDPIETAQKTVDAAVKECKEKYGKDPVVICLSHSGTEDGEPEGEDIDLANGTDGIDLIISGHTHSTLQKPHEVNDTYIVSAGEYGKYLGVAKFDIEDGETELEDYELIPVDESVEDDPEIAALVEGYKQDINENYLAPYGLTFDTVLLNNPYKFDSVDEVYDTQHESTLGNLFADAYKWYVEEVTGEKVDMALTAAGVIRETLYIGDVTVSDVFNAASLGVGTEGELVEVYITGKDLKNALEVDASVQPLMSSAQLFCSGVEYSLNQYRMIFNKVDYARLRRDDGSLEKIENKKLYRVITGMYMGQMLGTVEKTSFGLIKVTPRDKDGNPISQEDLKNYVVKDKEGKPLKEWYAICAYLQEMGGTMDARYEKPDGRKVVYKSLNPIKMLRGANIFTYAAILIIILLLLLIYLIVRLIIKLIKKIIRKRKAKKSPEEQKPDEKDISDESKEKAPSDTSEKTEE